MCPGWLRCLPLHPGLDEGGDVGACDDGGVGGATGRQTHSCNITTPSQNFLLPIKSRMSLINCNRQLFYKINTAIAYFSITNF